MNRSVVLLVVSVIAMCATVPAATVYNLYNDRRAMKIDDIVTVLIVESAKAGSQSGTSTSKENSFGIQGQAGTGALRFLPGMSGSAGGNTGYDGKGETSREGSLVARVAANVTSVLGNGNLVIEGSKVVEINNEKEVIKVTGTIRPQDVLAGNIIYSYQIADAAITYSGKGVVATAQRPGLFARLLNWIF